MKEIATISGYKVYWDSHSGAVNVGAETATDASGKAAIAYSQARAEEVARDYIRRALGG